MIKNIEALGIEDNKRYTIPEIIKLTKKISKKDPSLYYHIRLGRLKSSLMRKNWMGMKKHMVLGKDLVWFLGVFYF